jgi:hypothetical protein
MKPARELGRELSVTLSRKSINVDLPIDDDELVDCVFLGLAAYVKKGFPIKVKQAYATFSGTQEVLSKIYSTPQQVADWRKELKSLSSALLKR